MSYLGLTARSLERFHHTMEKIIPTLPDFDAIAFRGMSGALVAPTMAVKFNKHLIIVRKDAERSHGSPVETPYKSKLRYIIIDDFVDSGETIQTIRREVQTWDKTYVCVGYVLYNANGDEGKFVGSPGFPELLWPKTKKVPDPWASGVLVDEVDLSAVTPTALVPMASEGDFFHD